MEQFLKHMVDYYASLDEKYSEKELVCMMENDIERAQVLFEAGILIRDGKRKEGLQKVVDYMNGILLKAGITSDYERLEIIRNAVKNTFT